MKRITLSIVIILTLSLLLSGCSSKRSDEETAAQSMDAAYEAPAPEMVTSDSMEEADFSLNEEAEPFMDTMPLLEDETRKITYTGSASIETETFDETLIALDRWVNSFQGMISSSRIEDYGNYNQPRRYAAYTIKIPAEHFQEAVQELQAKVHVRRLQLESQDVTDHYYDLTARIESAQTHEQRLLDLVEKATELKDVLALEQELNRIRYEIESNQGILRRLENQVRYSTLYLDVQETRVLLPEPTSFWDRVKNQIVRAGQQIVNGFQSITLWLILWLPTILIFVALGFILFKFFSKLRPIWKKKKAPLESDRK